MQDWINPLYLKAKSIKNLNKKFKKAKPFPHLVIHNFLNPKKALIILKEIKKERFIEKESDLFQFKQTNDLFFSKNKIIKEFNQAFLSWEFFNLIAKMTDSNFKGTLDMAATLYKSADYLLPHDDKLEGRKIAYVLYLSKNIKEKNGGSFVLYNSKNRRPTTMAKKIPPVFNSLLLFQVSQISFHEVEENISNKKRFAIGGWLY